MGADDARVAAGVSTVCTCSGVKDLMSVCSLTMNSANVIVYMLTHLNLQMLSVNILSSSPSVKHDMKTLYNESTWSKTPK